MLTPFAIDSSNRMFYNAKDICAHHPALFKGIRSKIREIVARRRIPSSEYLYASFSSRLNRWAVSDSDSTKAQLLISRTWVDHNMLAIPEPIAVSSAIHTNPIPTTKKRIIVEESDDEEENEDGKEELIEDNSIAPPILELETHEKFHDIDGNVLEIETRGERHPEKIFFLVTDVMRAFDMPNLDHSLRIAHTRYERGVDFLAFAMGYIVPHCNLINPTKLSLHLTYIGMLRVLFCSRNKNAHQFVRWASQKLFTMQMGTRDDREDLIREMVTNLDSFKTVLKTYPQTFPCIYLLRLGRVGDLRETFSLDHTIDDDSIVCKFGCSKNLDSRLDDHKNDYGKLKNVCINVEAFHYIDPIYRKEAEGEIRNIFDSYGMRVVVPNRIEMVALNEKQIKRIKKDYARTGKDYAGATEEMQLKIQQLTNEQTTRELQHQIELMKETAEKEKWRERAQTLEQLRTLEISNLELQLQLFKKE